jgi:hypothetical protein
MSTRLVACSECARHVKVGECICPFCGAKARCPKPVRRVTERLTRAALGAAGAAGAVIALADCSSGSGSVYAPYGGAPVDAWVAPDAETDSAREADAPADAAQPDSADGGATPDAPSDAPSDGD